MFGVWHLLFVPHERRAGEELDVQCSVMFLLSNDVSLEARTAWSEAGVERGVSQ